MVSENFPDKNSKIQIKSQKRSLWKRTFPVICCFAIAIAIWKSTYFQPGLYITVIDQESQKPISFTALKLGTIVTWFNKDKLIHSVSVVSDKHGQYKFHPKWRIEPCTQSFTLHPLWEQLVAMDFQCWSRNGQKLKVWFPGYNSREISIWGDDLLKGNIVIKLRKAKTRVEKMRAFMDCFSEREGLDPSKTENILLMYERKCLKVFHDFQKEHPERWLKKYEE